MYTPIYDPHTGDNRNNYDFDLRQLRLANGSPLQLPDDVGEAQEYLRSLKLDDVMHSKRILDMWREAQSGNLGEFLSKSKDEQVKHTGAIEHGESPIASAQADPVVDPVSAKHDEAYRVYKAPMDSDEYRRADKSILPHADYVRTTFGDDLSKERFTKAYSAFEDAHSRMESKKSSVDSNAASDYAKEIAELRKKLREEFKQKEEQKPAEAPEPSAVDSATSEPANLQDALNATVPEAMDRQIAMNEPAPESKRPSLMEGVHMALDAWGTFGDAVVPGTGVLADGANASMYLLKAATDPKNAREHLTNAGISAVSMIPFVGDFAKVGKYGARAAKGAKAAKVAETELKAGKAAKSGWQNFGTAAAGAIGGMFGFGGSGGGGDHNSVSNFAGLGGDGGGSDGTSSGAGSGGGDDGGDGGVLAPHNPRETQERWTQYLAAMGGVIGAYGILLKSLDKFNDKIGSVTEQTLKQNEALKMYNGDIAASYSNLTVDRMQRSMVQANEMAAPISRLSEATSEREQATQDWSLPYQKFGTNILTLLNKIETHLLKFGKAVDVLDDILDWLNKWIEKISGDESKLNKANIDMAKSMQSMLQKHRDQELAEINARKNIVRQARQGRHENQ